MAHDLAGSSWSITCTSIAPSRLPKLQQLNLTVCFDVILYRCIRSQARHPQRHSRRHAVGLQRQLRRATAGGAGAAQGRTHWGFWREEPDCKRVIQGAHTTPQITQLLAVPCSDGLLVRLTTVCGTPMQPSVMAPVQPELACPVCGTATTALWQQEQLWHVQTVTVITRAGQQRENLSAACPVYHVLLCVLHRLALLMTTGQGVATPTGLQSQP